MLNIADCARRYKGFLRSSVGGQDRRMSHPKGSRLSALQPFGQGPEVTVCIPLPFLLVEHEVTPIGVGKVEMGRATLPQSGAGAGLARLRGHPAPPGPRLPYGTKPVRPLPSVRFEGSEIEPYLVRADLHVWQVPDRVAERLIDAWDHNDASHPLAGRRDVLPDPVHIPKDLADG